ncbi:MAG: hypothetical protein NTY48_02320 [Candidatus Diapherotrites archaeon]|nr:hypothetical protein [Candidatus Diapherotrites archaeon]
MSKKLPKVFLPADLARRRGQLNRTRNLIERTGALIDFVGPSAVHQSSHQAYAASGALKNSSAHSVIVGKDTASKLVTQKNVRRKLVRRKWLLGYKHKIPLHTVPKH